MELLEQDPVIEISTVAEKSNVSREDRGILWEMVSRVGDDVNVGEREELFSLLLEFADVFSLSTKNLGHTKVLQHRIYTGNAQPVHLPPRRIPQARREELKEMLRDMLEKNAIEQSNSPWSSPISVLVKKKDDFVSTIERSTRLPGKMPTHCLEWTIHWTCWPAPNSFLHWTLLPATIKSK